MMPHHRPARVAGPIVLALAALLLTVQGAQALRVCTYNVENWPSDIETRAPYFRTVIAGIDPDVIVLQEVESPYSVVQFLNEVLEYVAPGEYRQMPFANGPDTDNACFYKPAVVDSIFYEQIYTDVRWTTAYRFRPDGYDSSDAGFTILSTHLKAGSTQSDADDRLVMTTEIRSYLNDYPANSNFMVAGDFNLQSSSEASYQMLIGYQTDNDGRCKDPINTGGSWHDNYSLRLTHTQATTEYWGGMDDRFDFILESYALGDGDGLDYVSGSYTPYGNDGLHFNLAINDPPTNAAVGQTIADALAECSDHVPVYLDLQLPAKVGAVSSLGFGSAIIGSTAPSRTLTVTNVASAPAGYLDYSLAAPSGFTAPAGSFSLGPGQHLDHTVTMSTASLGAKSGDLEVLSNDLDDPTWNVALSGTVVDHATPSLSGSHVALVDTLDFGSAPPGGHDNQALPVYNDGYTSLQALLQVYDAAIAGGDGRFSFAGGFAAKTAGGSPADYEIAFDSSGAAGDSLYTATLTLATRDDPGVSGGTNLDDLTVHLVGYVQPGDAVGDALPSFALGPGRPNPFTERVALALTLPVASETRVGVYDARGRLVRTLASGILPAGEHLLTWDGRDEEGLPVASGIYFCRAEAGDRRETRKVALLH
jgi:endonuclease/exonuclease/phosphatase family metal-dependent hydrolase